MRFARVGVMNEASPRAMAARVASRFTRVCDDQSASRPRQRTSAPRIVQPSATSAAAVQARGPGAGSVTRGGYAPARSESIAFS